MDSFPAAVGVVIDTFFRFLREVLGEFSSWCLWVSVVGFGAQPELSFLLFAISVF